MPAKRWIWTLLRKCCAAMGSVCGLCVRAGAVCCARQYYRRLFLFVRVSFPYRLFGDEVESIRTFEVESQLSKEKKEEIVIVPDLSRSLEQGGMVAWFLSWIFCGRIPCWRCVISFGCGSVFRSSTMNRLPHRLLQPAKPKKTVQSLWKVS